MSQRWPFSHDSISTSAAPQLARVAEDAPSRRAAPELDPDTAGAVRLWVHLIGCAVRGVARRNRADRRWLTDRSPHLYGCRWACESIGIEHAALVQRVLKIVDSGDERELLCLLLSLRALAHQLTEAIR